MMLDIAVDMIETEQTTDFFVVWLWRGCRVQVLVDGQDRTVSKSRSNCMLFVDLDASHWMTTADFYSAILQALGAPAWHGKNVNALIDTMIWDDVNELKPPYTIRVRNADGLDARIRQEIEWARQGLTEARAEFIAKKGCDVDVTFKIVG